MPLRQFSQIRPCKPVACSNIWYVVLIDCCFLSLSRNFHLWTTRGATHYPLRRNTFIPSTSSGLWKANTAAVVLWLHFSPPTLYGYTLGPHKYNQYQFPVKSVHSSQAQQVDLQKKNKQQETHGPHCSPDKRVFISSRRWVSFNEFSMLI